MAEAVICIVPTEQLAYHIVDSLRLGGFNSSDVSILMPDRSGSRDLGHEKHSKAPEGLAAGASAGAIIGGALGWLSGIGAVAIPGLGPFIAAGPIMAMLGGVALGGTIGGATGGLIGLGLPEYEAKQYEQKLLDGNILLSFHTENNEQAKRAEDLFKALGARDITRVSECKVKVSKAK